MDVNIRIAGEAGLSMPEMALRYGLSLPGVTGVLTGVETVEQMAENIAIAARGPLPPDLVELVVLEGNDVDSIDHDTACIRLDEPNEMLQKHGFSLSGPPNDDIDLVSFDFQVHTAQDLVFPETLLQTRHPDVDGICRIVATRQGHIFLWHHHISTENRISVKK